MGLVTVRPVATPASAGWTAVGGTTHGAVADSSDASYVWTNVTTYAYAIYYTFATPVIPAGSIIKSVQTKARGYYSDPGGGWLKLNHYNGVGGSDQDVLLFSSTVKTVGGVIRTSDMAGAAWQPATIGSSSGMYLQPWLAGTNQNWFVYELMLDVIFNEAPGVTAVTPTGTITESAPAFTFTYSDPEGDPINRLRIKVFSAAQYGAAGFDPNVSTPTWDSTDLSVSAGTTSYTAPQGSLVLPNDTYRAYMMAADAGSDLGRGPGYYRYSAWSYTTFTVNALPPAVPVLTAVVETF